MFASLALNKELNCSEIEIKEYRKSYYTYIYFENVTECEDYL